jgi:SP family arabinose:H+ symporter-like MFS transporter
LLASILLYVAFFAIGMGPGPWLIISEIFPTKVRGRAASIATSTLWSGHTSGHVYISQFGEDS